jgi:hypothetical protein
MEALRSKLQPFKQANGAGNSFINRNLSANYIFVKYCLKTIKKQPIALMA